MSEEWMQTINPHFLSFSYQCVKHLIKASQPSSSNPKKAKKGKEVNEAIMTSVDRVSSRRYVSHNPHANMVDSQPWMSYCHDMHLWTEPSLTTSGSCYSRRPSIS